MSANKGRGLLERLRAGEDVICAEGYTFELERRGYMKIGTYTPEVVLDVPEAVRSLYEEFVHAGSDVVEALMYYGHRAKLATIGREDELHSMNLAALKIARDVADRTGTLMAGSLCMSGKFDPDIPETAVEAKEIFKEQVEIAVKGQADFIIAETLPSYGEAELALEAILKYGKGLPAVVTLSSYFPGRTVDDVPFPLALRKLEEAGAAVVGLNCGRGPTTMLPLLREIRKTCKGPIAALPVVFHTTDTQRSFQSLINPVKGNRSMPMDLFAHSCNRSEVRQFAEEARKIGVQYIGLCCGNASHYLRELAAAYGRTPPAMKYKPDLAKSIVYGENATSKSILKLRSYQLGEVE